MGIIITLILIFNIYLFVKIKYFEIKVLNLKRRCEINALFTAGIIRSISDYRSENDTIDYFEKKSDFPLKTDYIFGAIAYEMNDMYSMDTYKDWVERDINAYVLENADGYNTGLNEMYKTFRADLKKKWYSEDKKG